MEKVERQVGERKEKGISQTRVDLTSTKRAGIAHAIAPPYSSLDIKRESMLRNRERSEGGKSD